jgi:hypothetical protein
MRSAMFYLAHSTAIVGLMIGSYFYGAKQALNNAKQHKSLGKKSL